MEPSLKDLHALWRDLSLDDRKRVGMVAAETYRRNESIYPLPESPERGMALSMIGAIDEGLQEICFEDGHKPREKHFGE